MSSAKELEAIKKLQEKDLATEPKPIEDFDITAGYNPETNNEVSQLTAAIAGIVSGGLKIP